MVKISGKLAEKLVTEQVPVVTAEQGGLSEIKYPKDFYDNSSNLFYISEDVLQNALNTVPGIAPAVKNHWSESNVFEDEKYYTLKEYDEMMEKADREFVQGREAAMQKYKTKEDFYNTENKNDRKYTGYRKTKFTVCFDEGHSVEERQDIGDGEGGIIEHFENIGSLKGHCEIMRDAVEAENQFNQFQGKVKDVFRYEEDNNIPEQFRTTNDRMQVISREMVEKQYSLLAGQKNMQNQEKGSAVFSFFKNNLQHKAAPARSAGIEL